jgi:hypothetical protein
MTEVNPSLVCRTRYAAHILTRINQGKEGNYLPMFYIDQIKFNLRGDIWYQAILLVSQNIQVAIRSNDSEKIYHKLPMHQHGYITLLSVLDILQFQKLS